jgi:O-acetyl-ADP-ribose deacetylase (regulator of RNase III)
MIHYRIGDATEPATDGFNCIMHINNNLGAWGGGFVLSVSDKWSEPEKEYRSLENYVLGDVQLVWVGEGTFVANMIAQDEFPTNERPVAVDYDALRKCLRTIANEAPPTTTFHAPRIGCGIGGGSWDDVAPIIEEELADFDVYIYDLENHWSEYGNEYK